MDTNAQAPRPLDPVFEVLKGGDPAEVARRFNLSREELDRRMGDYFESRKAAVMAESLATVKAGRNDPCPCGSGKKYKKCCLPAHDEARKHIAPDDLRAIEERAKKKEQLDRDAKRGFDLLASRDYVKARALAERLLVTAPDDDRLHDIVATAMLAAGEYDEAHALARGRFQVAEDERAFFQENGRHRREAESESGVYFYSPSTWLEKLWIGNRARAWKTAFPALPEAPEAALARGLLAANDETRFKAKGEEGITTRRSALAPVLAGLAGAGEGAIPHLLPLTYAFSWASLFVPEILGGLPGETPLRLLADLSMFRFPYFAQACCAALEAAGPRAVAVIDAALAENGAFDELKAGLILVLGSVVTPESFAVLSRLVEHRSRYVVSWGAQALGRHKNPEALPLLRRAEERMGALSKIAGAIRELAGEKSL